MQSSLSSVYIKFTRTKEGKGNELLPTIFGTHYIPTQELRLLGQPHLQTDWAELLMNIKPYIFKEPNLPIHIHSPYELLEQTHTRT
jgi:hypothetical protein